MLNHALLCPAVDLLPSPRILLVVPHLDALPSLTAGAGSPALELKEIVHVLELQVGRLWEEVIDERNEDGVEDGEDDVRLPSNVVDGRRRKLHHSEVDDPKAGRRHCCAARSQLECADLRGVQPRAGQPALGEDSVEEEEHGGADDTSRVAAVVYSDSKHHHGHGLPERSPHEHLPSPNLLDVEAGRDRREHVLQRVEAGHQLRHTPAHVDRVLEDDGRVLRDQVDTAHLAAESRRQTEQHPPAVPL